MWDWRSLNQKTAILSSIPAFEKIFSLIMKGIAQKTDDVIAWNALAHMEDEEGRSYILHKIALYGDLTAYDINILETLFLEKKISLWDIAQSIEMYLKSQAQQVFHYATTPKIYGTKKSIKIPYYVDELSEEKQAFLYYGIEKNIFSPEQISTLSFTKSTNLTECMKDFSSEMLEKECIMKLGKNV